MLAAELVVICSVLEGVCLMCVPNTTYTLCAGRELYSLLLMVGVK
jgi:hypothetical protein